MIVFRGEQFSTHHQFTKNELMGKINPSKDIHFVKIDMQYSNRQGMYMRMEAYKAFIDMYNAALSQGVSLKIVSAYRSFYHQKYIWEAKWTGKRKVDGENLAECNKGDYYKAKKILLYSSMPGSSRHHWGTDIDINSVEDDYFLDGKGKKEFEWLRNHASEYGYCQVYTADRNIGYQEEKWHWSYLPLSKPMLNAYINSIRIEDFKGFLGSSQADTVKIIADYVLGINPACK